MSLLEKLKARETKLAVVGLGYVGLPLAAAFSTRFSVIGFDVNRNKIEQYEAGRDVTEELGDERLHALTIDYTSDAARLREASFIVVAVPTPVKSDNSPDLEPVKAASELVGRHLQKGAVVVFESTVYPGVTEDVCLPILERASGFKGGRDFKIGYSPERINPGDKVHRLENICKIVSGMDDEALETIAGVYEAVVESVYRAPSIRVAEAAKLVENTQRDVNIAFMNELAMVCHRMNIDTNAVIDAMDTKWNALKFRPGLVGGHCIGIDPYYFIHEAELLGYRPRLIATGRRVNNEMSRYVADATVREMLKAGLDVARSNVYLMGMTFKEDCPDVRNSLPVDICHWLTEYGVQPRAVDPVADRADFLRLYGFPLHEIDEVKEADCLVFLVRHECFRTMSEERVAGFFRRDGRARVIIDVKSMFSAAAYRAAGYRYWSL